MKNKDKIYNGLTYIIVLYGMMISFYLITLNLGYISKIIIFLIYISPTIQNLYFLKIISIKKYKFSLIDIQKCILECILMILGITSSIYFFYIDKFFIYVSIPLFLASIEIFYIQLIKTAYLKQKPTIEYNVSLKNIITLNELKKYNKWNGFLNSIISSILFFPFILVPLAMPLNYFNILGFNIETFLIYLLTCILIFFGQTPFQQILDCKYNSFVKYKGSCIEYKEGGKGVGGYYTIKILDNDIEVTIDSKNNIFRKNEIIIVIFGSRSKQVIGFHL